MEPPINYRKEYKELFFHLLFLTLLIFSTGQKRSIPAANQVYNMLETIFVEEEFGDYNEKAFMDIANFEEGWDWIEGVLGPGLFESDVDDTGNIMMYNQVRAPQNGARNASRSRFAAPLTGQRAPPLRACAVPVLSWRSSWARCGCGSSACPTCHASSPPACRSWYG